MRSTLLELDTQARRNNRKTIAVIYLQRHFLLTNSTPHRAHPNTSSGHLFNTTYTCPNYYQTEKVIISQFQFLILLLCIDRPFHHQSYCPSLRIQHSLAQFIGSVHTNIEEGGTEDDDYCGEEVKDISTLTHTLLTHHTRHVLRRGHA